MVSKIQLLKFLDVNIIGIRLYKVGFAGSNSPPRSFYNGKDITDCKTG